MAAADTSKIRTKLSNLSFSLDNLESLIEPLLAQSLSETLLELEPLQQAKLQTILPYVVYDLVFSYLKLEGIDPKTHPVIGELDRIRQYFDKVSNTENPPARKAAIDKEAAGRFIKHAIASVKWIKTAAEEAQEEGPTTSKVPVKITSKMLERQKYEEELMKQDAEDGSEEDTLEVFELSKSGNMDMEVDKPKQDAQVASKRRRPAVDPFSGYGDGLDDTSKDKDTPTVSTTPPSTTPIPTPTSSKKKKRKSIGPDTSEPSVSGSKKKKKASS